MKPAGARTQPDDRVKGNYGLRLEEQYAKLRVITPVDPNDKLSPRALIAGLAI